MKKKSRLAVLLAVVLLSAIVLSGAVFAETTREMPFSAGEVLTLRSAENVEATKLYMQLMECTTFEQMFSTVFTEESYPLLSMMNQEQLSNLYNYANLIYNPVTDDEEFFDQLLQAILVAAEKNGINLLATENNVHNVTTNVWYATLSDAVLAAAEGNVIQVYESFTENKTAIIEVGNLTIQAAEDRNVTISWSETDEYDLHINFGYGSVTKHTCIVVKTPQSKTTTFGGNSGTLTLDASMASDADNAGKRARVMAHLGPGTLEFKNGIVIKGGNTGGGNYNDTNNSTPPYGSGSSEVQNFLAGQGAGLIVREGTFNMSGGVIRENYSLWGAQPGNSGPATVGGGGGVYLCGSAVMNMSGGTITHNAAGTNGGGGLTVDGGTFNMTGGEISYNRCNFASGGGIYAPGGAKISIKGGTIKNNSCVSYGGGLFSRGEGSMNISNGTFKENSAGLDGGAITYWSSSANIDDNTFSLSGTTEFINNTATGNGGAVAVGFAKDNVTSASARMIISGNATVKGNKAGGNGGAFYLQELPTPGTYIVDIKSGSFENNEADNGGVIYVTGGSVTMSGGTMRNNEARKDGGAVFINGGGFEMQNGTVTYNTATNGGAVYVTGGDFNMISGEMSNNTAIEKTSGAAEAGNEGYGGAVYAAGGNIYIGVAACNGKGDTHTGNYTDLAHPTVTKNEAPFGGALAVNGGKVHIYCGEITENKSDNDGTGMNVFMTGDKSELWHYMEHAEIGGEEDHGMVSVGGKLTIVHGSDNQFTITITYFSNEILDKNGVQITWTGTAPEGYFLNLPYCPASWQKTQDNNGLVFVGWAESEIGTEPEKIRSKTAYKPVGTPVMMEDIIKDPNTVNGDMYFYAVWAPKVNDISYRYFIDTAEANINDAYTYEGSPDERPEKVELTKSTNGFDLVDAPITYNFAMTSGEVPIGEPAMAGYTFMGWKMYADTDKIANWDMDATQYPPTTISDLKVQEYLANNTLSTLQNFGDITLVAVFEPAYSGLKIVKAVAEGDAVDQQFIFEIEGTAAINGGKSVNMQVVIDGTGSQIIHLPVGIYTVTELENWSWRYDVASVTSNEVAMPMQYAMRANTGVSPSQEIVIDDPTQGIVLTFTNSRVNEQWLDASAIVENKLR